MRFLSDHFPQKSAIIVNEQQLTFTRLREEITRYTAKLLKLPPGILLLTANHSIEFVIQLMAALQVNKPVALFSNHLSEQDIQSGLAILGTSMTIDAQGHLLDYHEHQTIQLHPELALVLFTSGTTGGMKAVQLSSQNIIANCHAVIKALAFSKVQSQLLFLPLSYSFGLLGQLLPGLMSGLTTHFITHFADIKALLETDNIPQMWSGVPSHWVAINRMAALYPAHIEKITAIISAGAPLSTTLRSDLKKTFPKAVIYNNYGLTEASPRVLAYSSEDPLFLDNYAGYPIGDWQVKLSEDNELLIQGSQMMLGYLGDSDNEKIRNGWMHTGDIADILPNGLIAIKGRKDNIVNIGGEKINVADIERQLCQLDRIKEVIVLPVADDLYGTRLIAFFERSSLPADSTMTQLTEQICQHLLPKKLPLTVQILEQLPRNQHGKLDRRSLLATTRK